MYFVSTSDPGLRVSFKDAAYMGLAPGSGLFVPETIPQVANELKQNIESIDDHELAFQILFPFVQDDLSESELRKIIKHAFQFEIPIKRIGKSNLHVIELFHGPTWSFKDFGAGFLAGCLSTWVKEKGKQVTILVATSGDTGGAVAHAFYQKDGINVVVLYPEGKISPLQEMQIASLGDNIHAVAIQGSFDDCQRLVKEAFSDKKLRDKMNITSANSINIARWLPQIVFYALVWKYAKTNDIETNICIPSGNYGNITSGMLLHRCGMQFKHFLAAHNLNDTIPRYIKSHIYHPFKTKHTLANAMDVSDPNNFVRLKYLWKNDESGLEKKFHAEVVNNEDIIDSILRCWIYHGYLLDPHTATGWKLFNERKEEGIIVATAHPQKFERVILPIIGTFPEHWKKGWPDLQVNKKILSADYNNLRKMLLSLT